MIQVDWSKAPDDAKSFGLAGDGRHPVWVGPDWYEYINGGRRFDFEGPLSWSLEEIEIVEIRPTPWTGQGLPPVGLTVKIPEDMAGGNDFLVQFQGLTVDIVAHSISVNGSPVAVFRYIGPCGHYRYHALVADNGNFEAIPTPEQLAAEAREKAIEHMAMIGCMADSPRSLSEKLYDAGYRLTKQEGEE